jgi:hypothetical protein
MTVAAAAPRGRWPKARPVPGRLLRLELHRNAMVWILPLIAVLFWFDSYRPTAALPPLWSQRTFYNMGQGHTLIDFGPFVAGVAAWMGSRDGRHAMFDLVTATARPRWTAQLATWAATACWAVGAYLAFVGVLYLLIAQQVSWGGPPWWPVAAGAAGVAAFSALGFAAGAHFPSRFAAPLAAFGGFLAMAVSSQTGFKYSSGWALILPTNSNHNYGSDAGIFFPYLPDLQIARVMFLAGLAVAAVGSVGLPARAGSLRLRRFAAVITLAGLAAVGTGVGLAETAQPGPRGTVIPALHDAAGDRPIPYSPVCGHAATVPVCLHPAYRPYLRDVTAALRPVLSQVADLPGAPVRATQIAATIEGDHLTSGQVMTLSGSPPTLRLPLGNIGVPDAFGFNTGDFIDQVRLEFVHAFVGAGMGIGTQAQQALQAALLRSAGVPLAAQAQVLSSSPWAEPGPGPGTADGAVDTAARRFTALPAAARHSWLADHLGALRAGRVTLTEVP